MPDLSACIEWLFAEEPIFAHRIDRASETGLPCVEFWTWRDKALPDIVAAVQRTGIAITSFLSQPHGQLTDTATHGSFLAGIAESAEVAQTLGSQALIVVAGSKDPKASPDRQFQAVVDALRRAAPIAATHNVTLLLEPINTRYEEPAGFLGSTTLGLDIIEEVNAPNVKLLYDIYHSVLMDEVPAQILDGRMHLVGHVHFADVPDRHEPGTGTIDWPAIVDVFRRSAYGGRIGLEYMPSTATALSLSLIESLV